MSEFPSTICLITSFVIHVEFYNCPEDDCDPIYRLNRVRCYNYFVFSKLLYNPASNYASSSYIVLTSILSNFIVAVVILLLFTKERCKLFNKKIWLLFGNPMSRERNYAATYICSKRLH